MIFCVLHAWYLAWQDCGVPSVLSALSGADLVVIGSLAVHYVCCLCEFCMLQQPGDLANNLTALCAHIASVQYDTVQC